MPAKINVSDKTPVEQAQLLADYIRSQNKPDDYGIVIAIVQEQQDRILNSPSNKSKRETFHRSMVIKGYDEKEINQSLDKFYPLSPEKPHINDTTLTKIKIRFGFNKQATANTELAFALLTEILEADGKDLSALDGGKKAHKEIREELVNIVAPKRLETNKGKDAILLKGKDSKPPSGYERG